MNRAMSVEELEVLKVRLLGPVEIQQGGRIISLGGLRQRALLADLAINVGRVVSVSQLIDDLWGDDPPASAPHAIEASVSRLRSALRAHGAHGSVVTRPPGYSLQIDPQDVDAREFERLAAEGRAYLDRDDASQAADLLRRALALWRGPALADLNGAPLASVAAQRLEAARLLALEDCIEAHLKLGRHRELLGELEALVSTYPFHERFHEQLVLSLYRSGRQGDALAAYRHARDTLGNELGIEPRPELQRLQVAILRHDSALEGPLDGATAGTQPRPPTRPRTISAGTEGRWTRVRQPRVAVAIMAALMVATLVIVGLPLVFGDDIRTTLPAKGIGAIDIADGTVAWSAELPDALEEMAVGAGSVWATSSETRTLYRFDAETHSVTNTIPVGAGAGALAIGAGSVWVANSLDGTVSRVDIETNRSVQTIDVGSAPTSLAFGEDGLWIAEQTVGTLSRINPETGEVVEVVGLSSPPTRAVIGQRGIWVSSRSTNSVLHLDASTGQIVQSITVGGGPDAIASAFGKVWVANALDSTVSVIEPATGVVVATIPVGLGPSDLAVGPGEVWVTSPHAGSVVRIDPEDQRVTRTMPVGDRPSAVAIVDDRLWVGTGVAGASEHRGGTLRFLYSVPPASIDPANAFPATTAELSPVYDTLLTFERVGGKDGLQLVPDLALAIPPPTNGGTLYTLVIRDDIRYSDGQLLQPEDFRYGLERALAMNPAAVPFFAKLVGASTCTRHPPSCDLSDGITVDDRARTVSFHLTSADPVFLYKLTLPFTAPVPPSVPKTDVGADAVPATGPYSIKRVDLPEELDLARNPWFHAWSAAARPDGYADEIVWRYGLTVDREIDLIERGEADWMYDPPGDRLAEITTRYPAQVHSNPLQNTDYAFLNTRAPPFDDLRVRRALNYAVDRDAVVALFGGPDAATPTCQVLPKTIPGHDEYCPYTVNPVPEGTWSGPDLARARRLVAASGTEGMRVTYWALPDEPWGAGAGRYVVGVLNRLGYRAKLRVLRYERWARTINDSRNKAQIGTGGWIADYPAASNFFDIFLRCSAFRPADPDSTSNSAEFCHPRLDRRMDVAERLQFHDPTRANALWARIDHRIVDLAPWVPLVTERVIDFTSDRVGNYQYHPVWGILTDQLWVR